MPSNRTYRQRRSSGPVPRRPIRKNTGHDNLYRPSNMPDFDINDSDEFDFADAGYDADSIPRVEVRNGSPRGANVHETRSLDMQGKSRLRDSSDDEPIKGAFNRISVLVSELRSESVSENAKRLGWWLYENKWFTIIIAIVALVIGIVFNRYVSWGTGLGLVVLGYLISRLDDHVDGFFFYIVGLVIFIIPYLW